MLLYRVSFRFSFLISFAAAFCLIAAMPSSLFAQTAVEEGAAKRSSSSSSNRVSEADKIAKAQEQLILLGYYTGKADGISGAFTKTAVRNFQRENKLPITEKLDVATVNAIDQAYFRAITPPPNYGSEGKIVQQSPVLEEVVVKPVKKGLFSRFGRIDFVDIGEGTEKKYSVELNDNPIIVSAQRAIIGHSSNVYRVDEVDALIITAYDAKDRVCQYKHALIVLNKNRHNIVPINNCTRDYNAQVDNGSLIIVFPEKEESHIIGATWRFDGRSLYKL